MNGIKRTTTFSLFVVMGSSFFITVVIYLRLYFKLWLTVVLSKKLLRI